MLQKAFALIMMGTVFMFGTTLPDIFKDTAEASTSETASTATAMSVTALSEYMGEALEIASLLGGFVGIILVAMGLKEFYFYMEHGGDYGYYSTSSSSSSSLRGHTATVKTAKKEATDERQKPVALKKEESPVEPKGSTLKATRTPKKKVQHIDISGRKRSGRKQSSLLDDIADAVPKPSMNSYSDSCSSSSSSSSSSSFGDSGSSSGCD
tara:strand:+ start:2265 stop:2894 length:630 start_codon:yes stop_codon:yes gene_type:complete